MKFSAISLAAALLLGGSAFSQTNKPGTQPPPDPANAPLNRRDVPPAAERAKPKIAEPSPRSAQAPKEKGPSKLQMPRDDGKAKHVRTGIGLAFEAGAGFGNFLDGETASATSPAGEWSARLVVGTRTHIAGEVAYVGSAQNIDILGLDDNAALVSNGLEGALRVNILTGMWQPYAVAGLGFTHYSVRSEAKTSDVNSEVNTAQFPIGVGLAFRLGGLVLDGRLAFHPATGNVAPGANLSTWDVNGKVGFEL